MNVLGRIFLNSHKEGRKDGFFVRCRKTFVLNNSYTLYNKITQDWNVHHYTTEFDPARRVSKLISAKFAFGFFPKYGRNFKERNFNIQTNVPNKYTHVCF